MPTYDLKCLSCGRAWERLSMIAQRHDPCDSCGGAVEQEFKHSVQSTVFTPYFDIGLGMQIESLPERRRAMRNLHLDYRDKLSPGAVSARRDRVEQERKERARA